MSRVGGDQQSDNNGRYQKEDQFIWTKIFFQRRPEKNERNRHRTKRKQHCYRERQAAVDNEAQIHESMANNCVGD